MLLTSMRFVSFEQNDILMRWTAAMQEKYPEA